MQNLGCYNTSPIPRVQLGGNRGCEGISESSQKLPDLDFSKIKEKHISDNSQSPALNLLALEKNEPPTQKNTYTCGRAYPALGECSFLDTHCSGLSSPQLWSRCRCSLLSPFSSSPQRTACIPSLTRIAPASPYLLCPHPRPRAPLPLHGHTTMTRCTTPSSPASESTRIT
jgi:hypothetical protein